MKPREVLHLLCSPFPTPQGTQASVAAFVRAANARETERARHILLVPDEAYGDAPADLPIERLPRLPIRLGERSGPSLARIGADLSTLARLRGLVGDRALVAHNVEAAHIAAFARIPYVYVAHTSMRAELPLYGKRSTAKAKLGALLDAISVLASERALAITPALASSLSARFSRGVDYLPQPWSAAPALGDREAYRRELSLKDELVVLHAGNLDEYQGIETLLEVMKRLGEGAVLALATESDASRIIKAAPEVAIRVLPLRSERDRERAHAIADVALFARSDTLGLPIKMLEAFAREVPVVMTHASRAGLSLGGAAEIVDHDVEALVSAVPRAIEGREIFISSARKYLANAHGEEASRRALEAALESLEPGRSLRSR